MTVVALDPGTVPKLENTWGKTMKMKVAPGGGISDSIRMAGVPDSMKIGEGDIKLEDQYGEFGQR